MCNCDEKIKMFEDVLASTAREAEARERQNKLEIETLKRYVLSLREENDAFAELITRFTENMRRINDQHEMEAGK